MSFIKNWGVQSKKHLELFILTKMKKKQYSFASSILYLISLGFGFVVFLRNACYNKGLVKPIKMNLPIVCIGNVKAGGTGKTSFVQMLCQDLHSSCKIGVVSKGYRGVGVSKNEVITPIDYKGLFVSSHYCGDEPAMLKKKFKDVEVLISKNRQLAIEKAKDKKLEIVILDDGFQQKKLIKDLIVLMIDPKNLFGKQFYLPRGCLRDHPTELKKADLLCLHYEYIDSIDIKRCCAQLRKYASSKIIATQRIPYFIKGEVELEIKQLRGKKVGLFCGIGNPEGFIKTLRHLGVIIIEFLETVDHGAFTQKELKEFSSRCRACGAEYLLCTEKDFIKIEIKQFTCLPIAYLDSHIEVIYGKRHYEEFKKKMVEMSQRGLKG